MTKQNKIRNFVIISHVDHGKSTLADRFLEITKTVETRKMKPQYLDQMDIERERGITIKMAPVRMNYVLDNESYTLNLIDTPGHVDFSYEVSRALSAVEGAILLVDATQGVQAQTLAVLSLAQEAGIKIIPAINKIDLPTARIAETEAEIKQILKSDIKPHYISGKEGAGVPELLVDVIKSVPGPLGDSSKPLKALIFDSVFDPFFGVTIYVRILDGQVKVRDEINFLASGARAEVKEVGIFRPGRLASKELISGEIGYIATGLKEPQKIFIGDTITFSEKHAGFEKIEALPGFKRPKSLVFSSFYPQSQDDFDILKDALAKLQLNDSSFLFEPESSLTLGRGFRCGFLGLLHLEIIAERLKREYNLKLVITAPQVEYAETVQDGKRILKEPFVSLKIITPSDYIPGIIKLLKNHDIELSRADSFGDERFILLAEAPLREIIIDFYDNLKSVTQGYASMNYEIIGSRPSNLVKLDILVAGEKVEALGKYAPEKRVYEEARRLTLALKDLIPPQLFPVALQGMADGKIIARETIRAARKDVTGYLYGGDVTRKKKLLEKQKKGKKELLAKGRVRIPPEVFLEVLRKK
ncbi:MAG: elongation factor 4 [Parcubacteria group bacterium]|nr:elongation factor 4 [Parcubacteria group bacterium]